MCRQVVRASEDVQVNKMITVDSVIYLKISIILLMLYDYADAVGLLIHSFDLKVEC